MKVANDKRTWWQKYRKDVFISLAILTTLIIAVMGWHWEETAQTAFWWSFWPIAAVTCDLLWFAAWAYFWNKDKSRRRS